MRAIASQVHRFVLRLLGNPCEHWMICLGAFGSPGMEPKPMLVKWRYGRPWGYDFFYLYGPYASCEAAKAECDRIVAEVRAEHNAKITGVAKRSPR